VAPAAAQLRGQNQWPGPANASFSRSPQQWRYARLVTAKVVGGVADRGSKVKKYDYLVESIAPPAFFLRRRAKKRPEHEQHHAGGFGVRP